MRSVRNRCMDYLKSEYEKKEINVAHSLAKGIKDKNIVLWFTPSDKELVHPEFPDVRPAILWYYSQEHDNIVKIRFSDKSPCQVSLPNSCSYTITGFIKSNCAFCSTSGNLFLSSSFH